MLFAVAELLVLTILRCVFATFLFCIVYTDIHISNAIFLLSIKSLYKSANTASILIVCAQNRPNSGMGRLLPQISYNAIDAHVTIQSPSDECYRHQAASALSAAITNPSANWRSSPADQRRASGLLTDSGAEYT